MCLSSISIIIHEEIGIRTCSLQLPRLKEEKDAYGDRDENDLWEKEKEIHLNKHACMINH